jgi:hypothetical protein
MGLAVTRLHRERGVRVWLRTEVRNWVPGEWGIGVHLTNGKVVVAGSVIVAVGGEPETDWLHGSGLDVSDGILCGPTCHVVGAADVVAAGDVARWPNHRFGAIPRRIEHWLNAVEMGRAAARNLLAGRAAAPPFAPLPRVWSEQYGERFQVAGMPGLGRETARLEGDPRTGPGMLGYFARGAPVAVLGRDSPRAMLRWTAELDDRTAGSRGRHRLPGRLSA